jgi:hypothetical protein
MKAIVVTLFFSVVLAAGGGPMFLASDAQAQPTMRGQPQPNTPEWEALWKKCRHAVFRKYGNHQRERRRYVLPSDRAVALTDACMANGGQVR